MNGFDAEKFKAEVNRLGLAAVEERETPEYVIALEKLKMYFIRFYGLFLYDVFNCMIGTAGKKKQVKIDSSLDFALKNYERIIESKVRNYDPEKANSSSLSFFIYLNKDFTIEWKKQYKRDEMINRFGGMNPDIEDHEIALLNKLQRLYDSLGNDQNNFYQIAADIFDVEEKEIRKLWNNRINTTIDNHEMALLKKLYCLYEALDMSKRDFYEFSSIIFDKPEKEIKKVWIKYKASLPVSLDEPCGPDDSSDRLYLLETVDSGVNIEKQMEEEDYIQKHLLLLNKIYHDSFMDKHKLAFPPHFTNEMIIGWVKEHQKTNVNFEITVAENWDLINIQGKRLYYNEANYRCISDWIFDWFEQVRRQILGKEIAEQLNMSASNYTKVCNQAIELIRKYE